MNRPSRPSETLLSKPKFLHRLLSHNRSIVNRKKTEYDIKSIQSRSSQERDCRGAGTPERRRSSRLSSSQSKNEEPAPVNEGSSNENKRVSKKPAEDDASHSDAPSDDENGDDPIPLASRFDPFALGEILHTTRRVYWDDSRCEEWERKEEKERQEKLAKKASEEDDEVDDESDESKVIEETDNDDENKAENDDDNRKKTEESNKKDDPKDDKEEIKEDNKKGGKKNLETLEEDEGQLKIKEKARKGYFDRSEDDLPEFSDQPSARGSDAQAIPPIYEDRGLKFTAEGRRVHRDGEEIDQENYMILKLVDMRPTSRTDLTPKRQLILWTNKNGTPKDWTDKYAIKKLNASHHDNIRSICRDARWSQKEAEVIARLFRDHPDISMRELAYRFNNTLIGDRYMADKKPWDRKHTGRTTESIRAEYLANKGLYDKGKAPAKSEVRDKKWRHPNGMTEDEMQQMFSKRADPSSAWVNYSSDVERENMKAKAGAKDKRKKISSSSDSKTKSSVKKTKTLSQMTISELREKAKQEKPAGFLKNRMLKGDIIKKFEDDEKDGDDQKNDKKGKDKSTRSSADKKRKSPNSSGQESRKKQKTKKSDPVEDEEEEASAPSKRKRATQSETPISPRRASLRSQSGKANAGDTAVTGYSSSEEEDDEEDEEDSDEEEEEENGKRDVPTTLLRYGRQQRT